MPDSATWATQLPSAQAAKAQGKSLGDPILNDATAVRHLDIMGGHLYGVGPSDYPLARSKGKKLWMTDTADRCQRPDLRPAGGRPSTTARRSARSFSACKPAPRCCS